MPTVIGDYRLPQGAAVLPAINLIHQRADIYPDPQRFQPERFLDNRSPSFTWIPFDGGIHRCLGASFARAEMRTVLHTLLSRAQLRPANSRPDRPRPRHITLIPHRGVPVVLEVRQPRRRPAVPAAAATSQP